MEETDLGQEAIRASELGLWSLRHGLVERSRRHLDLSVWGEVCNGNRNLEVFGGIESQDMGNVKRGCVDGKEMSPNTSGPDVRGLQKRTSEGE